MCTKSPVHCIARNKKKVPIWIANAWYGLLSKLTESYSTSVSSGKYALDAHYVMFWYFCIAKATIQSHNQLFLDSKQSIVLPKQQFFCKKRIAKKLKEFKAKYCTAKATIVLPKQQFRVSTIYLEIQNKVSFQRHTAHLVSLCCCLLTTRCW